MGEGKRRVLVIIILAGVNFSIWHFSIQNQKFQSNKTFFQVLGFLGEDSLSSWEDIGRTGLEGPEGKPQPILLKGKFLFTPGSGSGGAKFDFEQPIRIDSPLIYLPEHKNKETLQPDRNSLVLYRLAKKPNTLFHIRAVDHDNIGFGGGVKIALEIVETF